MIVYKDLAEKHLNVEVQKILLIHLILMSPIMKKATSLILKSTRSLKGPWLNFEG